MDPLIRRLPRPLQEAFAVELGGNTILAWTVAVLLFLAVFSTLLAVRHVLVRRLQRAPRTTTGIDDLLADGVAHTWRLVMAVVALYLAAGVLSLPAGLALVIRRLFAIAVFAQVGIWVSRTIDFIVKRHVQEQREAGQTTRATLIALFSFFAQLLLWTIVFLLGLENLGVDVTAMVAGLGIGGIAIGLALQNVLKDTFASLAIILDKPFVEGDVIAVENMTGTVEHIGLKTTRLRSVDGEQIVFGNDDLLTSRVRNFARLRERRILLAFGLAHGTPPDLVAQVPGWVREIVEAQELARFERAHLKALSATALEFEAVYHVLVPDHGVAMDLQHAVDLALLRRLDEAGVELAHPAQPVKAEGGAPPAGPPAARES